ncbi:hypothetical protein ACFORL_02760 [Legionella dresdenensis]|uniref:PH domain-containing protein n=1 Tax=Legionella dresdenensis TaxID=450200 RepID=A0ABV8CCG4_9GAMM
MTLSTLFRPFTENQKKITAVHSKNTKPKNNNAEVYPLEQLPELIELMKTERAAKKRELRYLVDAHYNLWFTLEGGDGGPILAHWKMTGAITHLDAKSIAAGIITLSADYTTIENINNKSGDFTPIFDRVKWPLAIFIVNREHLKIPLAANFKLVESPDIVRYSAQADELNAWVATLPEDICTKMKDQPQQPVTRTYTAPRRLTMGEIDGKQLFSSNITCPPTPTKPANKRPLPSRIEDTARMVRQKRANSQTSTSVQGSDFFNKRDKASPNKPTMQKGAVQDSSPDQSSMYRFQFADAISKLSTTNYAPQSPDFSNNAEETPLTQEDIDRILSL